MIQKKSIAVEIILTLITCGLYGHFAWIPRMDAEFKSLAGVKADEGLSGAVLGLVNWVTCWIYGMFWIYQTASRYKEDVKVLWTVVGIVCPIVAVALMQNELNKHAAE